MFNVLIKAKVLKYQDSIDTDVIFPGRYTYTINDPNEMAKHAMEAIDPSFYEKAKDGCILVCGKNFGCGSSREQAVLALKYAGVKAVIAKSFARIFYRNAINLGLIVIKNEDIYNNVSQGDSLEINLQKGVIKIIPSGLVYRFPPFPDHITEIIECGGLVNYILKKEGVI